MRHKTLATEAFSRSNKHYFLDFKLAGNNSNYIRITRSDEQEDHSFKRSQVIVFEEDFHFLIQAFASLFQSAAHYGSGEVSVQDLHRRSRNSTTNGIKNWEPELRPREKMAEKGALAMEDAELLAMLIGSGTPDESALDLARNILASVSNDPGRLAELGLTQLCAFAGMGLAKSCSVMAAMELGRRTGIRCTPVRRLRVASGLYMAVK